MTEGIVSYDHLSKVYDLDGCKVSREIIKLWEEKEMGKAFQLVSNEGGIVVLKTLPIESQWIDVKDRLPEPETKNIPEYFAIERIESDLWDEYSLWLQQTYGREFRSYTWKYYGYDGTANGADFINLFNNKVTLITLEEWKSLTK